MSIFLAQTALDFPDQYGLMVPDGAVWHRATALRISPRMRLIALPSYSPELNPVEHLCDHLRENHFGDRVLPSLTAVTDLLCQGLRELDQQPQLVHSLTYFDWIKTLSLT